MIGTPNMEEIARDRMKICKKCPLYKQEAFLFPKCNGNLYLNPETNDVSRYPKNGYVRGCSCYLNYKVNELEAKCPAGKW